MPDPVRSRRSRNNKRRGSQKERDALALLEAVLGFHFWRNADERLKVADVESLLHVVEVKSVQGKPPALIVKALGQMHRAMEQTGKDGHVLLAYTSPGQQTQWLLVTPLDYRPTKTEVELRRALTN